MASEVSAASRAILEALSRDGLLLISDRTLPSAVRAVSGTTVAGSWWRHPQANLIYDSLVALEDEQALMVPLVNGKQTLVAACLAADVVAVGTERAAWQLRGLTRAEKSLLAALDRKGPVRADRPPLGVRGTPIEVGKRMKRLERSLLAQGSDVHTASGRHVKALRPWAGTSRAGSPTRRAEAASAARSRFEAIASRWARTFGVAVTLPWQCS